MKAFSELSVPPKKELTKGPLSLLKEWSDEEINAGIKQGNESILGHIYNQYVRDLFRFGNQISRDKEIVKDCIQDVFVTIIRCNISISSVNSIRSYLYKSLYRAIIEKLKIQRKYLTDHPILDNPEGFEIEISKESRLIDEETYRLKVIKVNREIKNLSKKQKQAILLYYYDGFSQEEIAELMDLKDQNSVTKLIRRGLDAIRQNIGILLFLLFKAFY